MSRDSVRSTKHAKETRQGPNTRRTHSAETEHSRQTLETQAARQPSTSSSGQKRHMHASTHTNLRLLICPDTQTNRDSNAQCSAVSTPQLMMCPTSLLQPTRSKVNRRRANPHPTHKKDRHPRTPKKPFCTHTYSPNRTRLELTQAGKAYTRPAICNPINTHTRVNTHMARVKKTRIWPHVHSTAHSQKQQHPHLSG